MAKPSADFNFEKHSEEMLKKLGNRIKALRIAKGYNNYEKFAFEHDISRSQQWRHENGEDMKLSTLLKLAVALDVSITDFFTENS